MEMERSTKEVFDAINTARSHTFVDGIEGADLNDFKRTRLYEHIIFMIQGLNIERDQLSC